MNGVYMMPHIACPFAMDSFVSCFVSHEKYTCDFSRMSFSIPNVLIFLANMGIKCIEKRQLASKLI